MLRELTEINWDETTDVIPAAVTCLTMPFTYSIANGLAFGFITFAVLKACTGRYKEVHWMVWLIAGIFLFKFIWLGGH
jgi:AGZA family xanthine/uracil permease-like MFS transporter